MKATIANAQHSVIYCFCSTITTAVTVLSASFNPRIYCYVSYVIGIRLSHFNYKSYNLRTVLPIKSGANLGG